MTEKKEPEKKPKNKIYRTEDGIDILKEPENIKEEVMNSIFLRNKKQKKELKQTEIKEAIKEYKKEIEQKQK